MFLIQSGGPSGSAKAGVVAANTIAAIIERQDFIRLKAQSVTFYITISVYAKVALILRNLKIIIDE